MDLGDLLIFKTVAEEGGIVRAARKLHRVPSNVTTRIRQLESAIGAELFERDRRRLSLSARGELLLDYAQRLLQLADEARNAVAATPPTGPVRLGSMESTAASRLPGVLARFHAACPEVRVELQTGTNDAMLAALAERRVDAVFVAEPPQDPAFARLAVFTERLVLITPLGHRRVGGPQDLAGDSLIAFPQGCAYRRLFERWLGERRAAGLPVLELASYHAIIACVASGTGVAVMPASVLDTVGAAAVARHPLPRVHAEVMTAMVWRAADAPAAVAALRDLLRQGMTVTPAGQRRGVATLQAHTETA